jgi:hypothetical protein
MYVSIVAEPIQRKLGLQNLNGVDWFLIAWLFFVTCVNVAIVLSLGHALRVINVHQTIIFGTLRKKKKPTSQITKK